jgi:hypothetical protein
MDSGTAGSGPLLDAFAKIEVVQCVNSTEHNIYYILMSMSLTPDAQKKVQKLVTVMPNIATRHPRTPFSFSAGAARSALSSPGAKASVRAKIL